MNTNDVSIVVPTYSRPEFLKRLLMYFVSSRCKCPVWVADSSPEAEQRRNREICSEVSGRLDVYYGTFPKELHYPEKFARALAPIDSPFCALCSDDDFLVPGSVLKCAEFLDSHADYSIASGRSLYFSLKPPALTHGELETVGNYNQSDNSADTASLRVESHAQAYRVTQYAVHRTKELKSMWERARQYNLEWGELLPSFLALAHGKSARLEVLFLIKQVHPQTGTALYPMDAFDWLRTSSWGADADYFLECLASQVAQTDHVPSEEAKADVKRALWAYVAERLCFEGGYIFDNPKRITAARTYQIDDPGPSLQIANLISTANPFFEDFRHFLAAISPPVA